MIDRSWSVIFDNDLIELYDNAIDTLRTRYKYNDPRLDLRFWTYAKSNIYCIPRLLNIYKPFNNIKLQNVSCIVLFERPLSNVLNEAGIACSYPREFPVFSEYLIQVRDDMQLDNQNGRLDTNFWLSQGILPMYVIPTTYYKESSKINDSVLSEEHEALWKPISKKLIQNILTHKPNINIVSYSDTGRDIISSISKEGNLNLELISTKIFLSDYSIPVTTNKGIAKSNLISENLLKRVNKNQQRGFMYMW